MMLSPLRPCAFPGNPCHLATLLAVSAFALLSLLVTAAPAIAQLPAWNKLSSSNPPPARYGHELAYHAHTPKTVMYGGRAAGGLLGDTWVWDGSGWLEKTGLTTTPGLRENHSMCSFGSGPVLLFGGENLSSRFDELWNWDGAAWKNQPKSGTWPTRRTNAALCYDSARKVAVLFGGSDGGSAVAAKTWMWNGSSWSSVAAQSGGPVRRSGHTMSWDPAGKGVLMYGGIDGSGSRLTDTWRWNGSTWTKLASTGPAASFRGGMATDLNRGKVVYYGGNDRIRNRNETWEWHHSQQFWFLAITESLPPVRSNLGMAYDQDRKSILVFAGASGLNNDVWEYGNPSLIVPFGTGCSPTATIPSISLTTPHVGGSVVLTMDGFKPNRPASLILGSSRTVWGTLSLPYSVDKSIPGLLNCKLNVSMDIVVGIPIDSKGKYVSPPLPMPTSASAIGDRLFLQTYALDTTVRPATMAMSNALDITIGEAKHTLGWQVLPKSPLAGYYYHDDIFVIGETLWVCNIEGQIWRSTDGGNNWTKVLHYWGNGNPKTAFRTITFADSLRGWVGNLGTNNWVKGVNDTNPLYATTDGGITWTPVTNFNGPKPQGICGLWAVGPNTVYGAGRYDGRAYIIKTTDGGASWTSTDMYSTYDGFVDVYFTTPTNGYITGGDKNWDCALLHTTNGGASWTNKKTMQAYHYWKMGFATPNFGYAVCWWPGTPDRNKWIQTYDGGATWTHRSFYDKSQHDYVAIGIGFMNEKLGWIGLDDPPPRNTLQTTDGGATWKEIQVDPTYHDYINKFLKAGDNVMYAVGKRVYKYSADHSHTGTGIDNSLCGIAASSARGTTTVTYTVPKDGNAQITIFKRGGHIQARPVDKYHAAGTYRITFPNLPTSNKEPDLFASLVTGLYRARDGFTNN